MTSTSPPPCFGYYLEVGNPIAMVSVTRMPQENLMERRRRRRRGPPPPRQVHGFSDIISGCPSREGPEHHISQLEVLAPMETLGRIQLVFLTSLID